MQQILTKRNFAEAVIGTGMREGIKDQNGKRKKRKETNRKKNRKADYKFKRKLRQV